MEKNRIGLSVSEQKKTENNVVRKQMTKNNTIKGKTID